MQTPHTSAPERASLPSPGRNQPSPARRQPRPEHAPIHAPERKAVKTVYLEDRGQDFEEWDLDEDGRVVACRPFQEWLWKGTVVHNHRTLRRGQVLEISTNHEPDKRTTLNYRAEHVARCS